MPSTHPGIGERFAWLTQASAPFWKRLSAPTVLPTYTTLVSLMEEKPGRVTQGPQDSAMGTT